MMQIIQSKTENDRAQAWLKSLDPNLNIPPKDAAKTKFIIEKLSQDKEKYILDFCALNDFSLAYLNHKYGHKHLYGIDENKKIYDMPYYTQIKYSFSPQEYTHLPESFFDVVYTTNTTNFVANINTIKQFIDESKKNSCK